MDIDQLLAQTIKKAEASGKEPFDFAVFATKYVHDTGDCEQFTAGASDSTKRHYTRMYYLDYPEIKTIADFAKKLNFLDQYS